LIPNNPFLHSAQTPRGIDRFDAKKLAGSFVEKLAAIVAPTVPDRACGKPDQHKRAMSIPLRFVLENNKSQEVTTTWRRSVMVNCPTTFRLY
jgi:hypothetical protein